VHEKLSKSTHPGCNGGYGKTRTMQYRMSKLLLGLRSCIQNHMWRW